MTLTGQCQLSSLKLLKMGSYSSFDVVPLNVKRKMSELPVYQHSLFELSVDPA
jgi:hypothetical protein